MSELSELHALVDPLDVVGARRRAVAGQAVGRVLDLGGWLDHLDAYTAATSVCVLGSPPPGLAVATPVWFRDLRLDEAALAGEGGRFDSIVSLARLPLVADPGSLLDIVAALAAPGGRLLFLEPTRPADTVVPRRGASAPVPVRHARFGRDVPALLRRIGTIGTLHRFEVDGPRQVRSWVDGIVFDLEAAPPSGRALPILQR